MKLIYTVFLFSITLFVNALPNIGVTELLYQNNLAINALAKEISTGKSTSPNSKFQVNHQVLVTIARQMPEFKNSLAKILVESGNIDIYDAQPQLKLWQMVDPIILNTIYSTTYSQEEVKPETNKVVSKAALESSSVLNTPSAARKYVLVGWVDNIIEHQHRVPIARTGKISFIYNLDIRVEYKLVNTENNQVVSIFTAVGHGGISRIISRLDETINYNIDSMVSDMFYSLAKNVRHVILLKQQQLIKDQIKNENAIINKKPKLNKSS